ncbi:Voltage-gated potassium channel subunit beta-2 [Fusarium falciforme]|nr:Voltage-gated potassium channel subunit beta-2 [Fusarium falciforme]
MASVAQSCLELLQQKLLDSVDNDDWGPVNQVQRADMFVTRQWMRAVLWRASLRFGIVIPGMNPIDIAKDFLSLVSEIPKAALESHGPTLVSSCLLFLQGNASLTQSRSSRRLRSLRR